MVFPRSEVVKLVCSASWVGWTETPLTPKPGSQQTYGAVVILQELHCPHSKNNNPWDIHSTSMLNNYLNVIFHQLVKLFYTTAREVNRIISTSSAHD